ncbi:MAG: ribulose-phosphate 3-epimerase [Patescibacteria group bacterium]
MQIVPAINCGNFECVKEKLQKAAKFFSPANRWAQIDIADGKFTNWKTWNNPSELSDVSSKMSNVNIEVHLMVENPQEAIDDWLDAGAKRIIVHFEALVKTAEKNPLNDFSDILNFILEKCEPKNVEVGLALAPKTPVEELIPYLNKISFIQILAVEPGLAGQKFQEKIFDKIKFLKSLDGEYADIAVEVDGGVNLETAKLCKEAGADILAAASYIWENQNPKAAFDELAKI